MRSYVKTLSALLILASVSAVHAQQQGGPVGGPPGMGNDGGPPDPQQMMQMIENRIKKAMAVNDETWATLQPMIDKVVQLAHEADTGPMMHGRPPRPEDQDNAAAPGEENDHPQSEIEAAASTLKKVLTDKTSQDDKIENAMKAVQDAEKKAKDDLADARKSLRAAVNLRQQAALVALGVLN